MDSHICCVYLALALNCEYLWLVYIDIHNQIRDSNDWIIDISIITRMRYIRNINYGYPYLQGLFAFGFPYLFHDDVIKWKHFPRNWPFVRKIHRSPVNFPHKGQWRGALMFSLIYVWINDWANNREAGDLRRQHGHYDVIVMLLHNCLLATTGFDSSRLI